MATLSTSPEVTIRENRHVADYDLCRACGESVPKPIWTIGIRRKSLQTYLRAMGLDTRPIQLVRCGACGSVYQSPMHTPSVYAGWYRDPHYDFYRGGVYPEAGDESELHAAKVLQALRRLTGSRWQRVLDVGCGAGVFMQLCANCGWEVTGCDPSPHRVQRQHCSQPILISTFEEADLRNSTFDLVSFWDVFEHFADPRSVLHKVRTVLKDGGIVAIEVPNVSSWYSRILGRRWWYDFEHIFYYSPQGISQLLAQCGFEVIAMESDNFNLLTSEGVARLGLLGEDVVWGRVGDGSPVPAITAWTRDFVEGRCAGFSSRLISRIASHPNAVLNRAFNSRLLGDQLRVFAKKGSSRDEGTTPLCSERPCRA